MRRFEYDAAGNLTAAIDENGHRTDYAYDPLNRVTLITDPDPGPPESMQPPINAVNCDGVGKLTSTTAHS